MIYAIGDIHGEHNLALDLYSTILEDIRVKGDYENTIVFLGDYTDRGEGSLKVFDFLRSLEDNDELKHIFLKGNHEVMLVEALEYPKSKDTVDFWLKYGGEAVLKEAVQDWEEFQKSTRVKMIRQWIKNHTKNFHAQGGYIFVHGGLDVRRRVETQSPDTLLWARHTEKDHYAGYDGFVVHGHTPTKNPVVDENRISVDTSQGNPGYKILTAACLPNRRADMVKPKFLKTFRYL